MRIVHIITSLFSDGAQTALYRLLSTMNREVFDPIVVSLTNRASAAERIERLGVPVFAVGIRPEQPTPPAFWRLIRTVRQLKPDLIQGWMYHSNLAAELVHMFLPNRVPVLWNIRHSIQNIANEKRTTAAMIKIGARLSHRPERIIYVGQSSALQHEALGYRADKRAVIPNGFDTQRFLPSEKTRTRIREELGLDICTPLIGSIARYHPMKDHGNFLHAAAYLLQWHPNVHFLLAGRNVDETNPSLTALIQNLGLGARTHLLGEQEGISSVMASLDIAGSSSSFGEGFPNVVAEAMACGVPCVVTDVGDSALIVGNTGRVVPPKDPQALALAWRELIDMGLEERIKLGVAARRRIKEHFSLAAVVSRYEDLYKHIMGTFLAGRNAA
jgi:glycosyltransferase involved in cell wall biosynthesis